MKAAGDDFFPDFRRRNRWRTSWTCCVKGFEPVLRDLRTAVPPPENEHCQLINVSSGKYVYHCRMEGWDFAYKTQRGKTFWRYLVRSSLPLRECFHYEILRQLGIPIPRVLAAGDTRKFFVLKESFLITDFLQDSVDGRIFMPGGKFRTGYDDLRRAFCIGNLKLLAKLHNAGYYHKAAHPRNFLFRGSSPDDLELFWIDVARMRKARNFRRTVIVDLHTFFCDMLLPRKEVTELLDIYLSFLDAPPISSRDELLEELIHFRRRRFSKRVYPLFDTDL